MTPGPGLRLASRALPILLVLLVTIAGESRGAGRADASETNPAGEPKGQEAETETSEEGGPGGGDGEEPSANPCRVGGEPDDIWIDHMRRGVYQTVCTSSRWFDSFYGDEPMEEHYRGVFGRLGVGIEVEDEEGLDLEDRFDARFPLPKFERRLQAFVGRYDEDEIVEGRERPFGNLPEVFDDTDSEWLLGLGYRPAKGDRGEFDVDLGVDLGFPMDPFVSGSWSTERPFGSVHLLRFEQTAFWRNSDGLGTTSKFSVDRVLGPRWLVRFFGAGTWAEKIHGVEWFGSLTFYQQFDLDRAIAYQVDSHGESDADVPVEEWSVNVRYRHRMWREWFFLDLRARAAWPREFPGQARDLDPGFTVGFEILFGDHPSLLRYRAEKARAESEHYEDENG